MWLEGQWEKNGCILKGDCRKYQLLNEPFHQLCINLEKSTKILLCPSFCMASIGEMCNHVAAATFQVNAVVSFGLTNPSCTSSANDWLPCKKIIEIAKLKDLNFNRKDFAHRCRKKITLAASPKKIQPVSQIR